METKQEEEPASSVLEGKTIVASGKLEHFTREEIEQFIEKHGGRSTSSVSKNTDFLLAGENTGPNKLSRAKELGIPIISEEEFLKMVGEE